MDSISGGAKERIQFSFAPTRRTTSASFNAVDRAAETLYGLESGMTPLPMGVGRNGNPVRSINFLSGSSARANAAPLPTTTSGAGGPFQRHDDISNLLHRSDRFRCFQKSRQLIIPDNIKTPQDEIPPVNPQTPDLVVQNTQPDKHLE